jgi:ABC-type antimicrobial peptide transport system permease subunit
MAEAAIPATQAQMAALTEVRKGATLWQRFRKHKMAVVGLAFMILVFLIAIFAPCCGRLIRPRRA